MAVAFQANGFQSTAFQETAAPPPVAPAFQSNAFQSTSGHVGFQTDVYTPPATTPRPPDAGGVIMAHSYSRKRHDEFMALLRAEREALERAEELKNNKQKKALVAAVEKAKAVARDAPPENVEELTLAIRQAAEARAAAVAEATNFLRDLADAIARQIEEEEEEFLLLT